METNQEKDPISHAVIGRAMEAHRTIGPGLKEPFYHQELSNLLTRDGIEHLWKPRLVCLISHDNEREGGLF